MWAEYDDNCNEGEEFEGYGLWTRGPAEIRKIREAGLTPDTCHIYGWKDQAGNWHKYPKSMFRGKGGGGGGSGPYISAEEEQRNDDALASWFYALADKDTEAMRSAEEELRKIDEDFPW